MNSSHAVTAEVTLTEALLRRLDVPGPRYTSYPTADRFVEAFGPSRVPPGAARSAPRVRSSAASRRCRCTSTSRSANRCATTAPATRSSPSTTSARPSTWTLLAPRSTCTWPSWAAGRRCRSCTWAAARPPSCPTRNSSTLMAPAARRVPHLPRCRGLDRGRSAHRHPGSGCGTWPTMGFNRISFGVQDFDADVQKAVHRVQPFEAVRELVAAARALGFESINADLIYGLPKQTPRVLRAHRRPGGANCGPTASRCTPTPTCRSASSRSGASTRPSCPPASSACRCWAARSPASSATAISTSAWTTSRCPTMRWRWPSARAGCTAISRATAPSPTAT